MLDGRTGVAGTGQASGVRKPAARLRLSCRLVLGVLGAGLLVVFMAQNTEKITVRFLVWNTTWPVWLFSLAMAVLGALVWIGWGVVRRVRRRHARRGQRQT